MNRVTKNRINRSDRSTYDEKREYYGPVYLVDCPSCDGEDFETQLDILVQTGLEEVVKICQNCGEKVRIVIEDE